MIRSGEAETEDLILKQQALKKKPKYIISHDSK
jgi:hypothetical protein